MFSRVKPHLTPSTAIAIIALVFAVTGGAFAATGGSGSGGSSPAKATASVGRAQGGSGSSGQAIATTAKSSKGKTGPRGPKGATGPAGPAGKNGAVGATGPAGAAGAPGAAGSSGESVSATTIEPGETCVEGGVSLTVGGKETVICNGKKGKSGKPGLNGAIHPEEVLPPEASETGSWAYGGYPEEVEVEGKLSDPVGEFLRTALSFTIPLKEGLGVGDVHYVTTPTTECPGTAEDPKAIPGDLCVYQGKNSGMSFVRIDKSSKNEEGASPAGAILTMKGGAEEEAWGTWAVTAPAES
jgi:Collagen triple helix repeat (20 copies)